MTIFILAEFADPQSDFGILRPLGRRDGDLPGLARPEHFQGKRLALGLLDRLDEIHGLSKRLVAGREKDIMLEDSRLGGRALGHDALDHKPPPFRQLHVGPEHLGRRIAFQTDPVLAQFDGRDANLHHALLQAFLALLIGLFYNHPGLELLARDHLAALQFDTLHFEDDPRLTLDTLGRRSRVGGMRSHVRPGGNHSQHKDRHGCRSDPKPRTFRHCTLLYS
jgi:hypothetical protein